MAGKITYTPFVPKFEIPESQATLPIPISLPISEYRGTDPDREVIPVQIPGEELEVKFDLSQKPEAKQEPSSVKWQVRIPEIKGTYKDRNKFVSDLTKAYEQELESRGLSKDYAKYIVAQDALESNWGKSSLARYYNFGGIKETRKNQGVEAKTKESHDGKTLTDTVQSFRKFDSLNDYIKYKLDLLGNSNYDVFSYSPDQLYTRLVTAKNKYATDPDYLNKMNQMYKSILAIS